MFGIREETLKRLREEYPRGCRVELVHMDDPYNTRLCPGCTGTVVSVDDVGTIHVHWDCGSSLGVVYGEDSCKRLDSVKVTCYGEEKVWDSRADAIAFYLEGMTMCEGSERDRYTNIYLRLLEGCTECEDTKDE